MLGLGYVGCVSAACMAQQGHRVIGVDRDEGKVGHIREKKAPFYEPGLAPIVEETVAAGRLTATTSLEEAIAAADVAMVCVGTPSDKNGNLSLEQLHRVAEQIAALLEKRSTPLTVAIRSTVWPGTCEDLYERFFHRSPMVRVVSNPEFLREGSAVKDFLEPSLLVVGGTDEAAVNQVADLYAGLPVEACKVALRTSETIKYACNAFHALKVAFANEIGSLCERINVPPQEVMATLCEDLARQRSLWLWLGGFLHPFEDARRFPTAALGFAALRETPLPPVCRADFNGGGGVTVQDIFDFLNAYLAGC